MMERRCLAHSQQSTSVQLLSLSTTLLLTQDPAGPRLHQHTHTHTATSSTEAWNQGHSFHSPPTPSLPFPPFSPTVQQEAETRIPLHILCFLKPAVDLHLKRCSHTLLLVLLSTVRQFNGFEQQRWISSLAEEKQEHSKVLRSTNISVL